MSETDEIRRVLALHCQLVDDGRVDEWAELFTSDGRLKPLSYVGAPPEREIVGRDNIRAWARKTLSKAGASKHINANALIDVHGDTASVESDIITFWPTAAGPSAVLAGRYRDRFEREDGRWLLATREAVIPSQEWLAPEMGAIATGPARGT